MIVKLVCFNKLYNYVELYYHNETRNMIINYADDNQLDEFFEEIKLQCIKMQIESVVYDKTTFIYYSNKFLHKFVNLFHPKFTEEISKFIDYSKINLNNQVESKIDRNEVCECSDELNRSSSDEHSRTVGSDNDEANIKKLSLIVKKAIEENELKHPNFKVKSRANYKRIKNFVHNITKVRLNDDEVDMFVVQFI